MTVDTLPKPLPPSAGFKLFTRGAVRVVFGTLHLERWGFDLEVVHLCDQLGLPMAVRACSRPDPAPAPAPGWGRHASHGLVSIE